LLITQESSSDAMGTKTHDVKSLCAQPGSQFYAGVTNHEKNSTNGWSAARPATNKSVQGRDKLARDIS